MRSDVSASRHTIPAPFPRAAKPFGRHQAFVLIGFAACLSLCTWPMCPPGCEVAVVGFFAGISSFLLACWGPSGLLALPWLSVMLFTVQNLAAPVYAYWFPAADPYWPIGPNFPRVVATASWAALAFLIGIAIPVARGYRTVRQAPVVVPDGLKRLCIWMLVVGYIACWGMRIVPWGSVQFVVVLVSLLRLVAGGVLVMSPGSGGKWCAALIGIELLIAAPGGMLHDLALIGTIFLCLLALSRGWRWRFALALLALFPVVHIVQCCKVEYRESAWYGRGTAQTMLYVMASAVSSPWRYFESDKLSITAARLNQGKIVEAIFNHVPAVQPFAAGSTLTESLYAAAVPRVVDPDKPIGSDRERFMRYTGHVLQPDVSMNLGILGEGYANFGEWGAIGLLLVYGLIFGAGAVFFLHRAWTHPLWWAWFGFVFYWWPKTEGGVADSLNHAVKATVVLLAVVLASKAWQKTLGLYPRRGRIRRADFRDQRSGSQKSEARPPVVP